MPELPHTTILRERTAALKAQRERAKAALDRARAQCGTTATIDARKIDAFSRLMNEKLDSGDAGARKGYVRSIIDAVDVDDHAVRIIGSRDILQAAVAGKQIENGNVRSFVRKWRARRETTPDDRRACIYCRIFVPAELVDTTSVYYCAIAGS